MTIAKLGGEWERNRIKETCDNKGACWVTEGFETYGNYVNYMLRPPQSAE